MTWSGVAHPRWECAPSSSRARNAKIRAAERSATIGACSAGYPAARASAPQASLQMLPDDGLQLMRVVAPRFPAPLGTGWETFVYPVLASVAMGIIFSYWPARMAARIAPAEALRND